MIPRIRQVQIRNYKSIGQAVVDLEPFTVLVGANGSGKSNFVDALAFVQESLDSSPHHALANRGGARVISQWASGSSARFGFRVLIELAESAFADYTLEIARGASNGFQVARERCRILSGNEDATGFEVAEGRFLQEIPGIRPQISPDRLALFAAAAVEEFRPVYDFLTSMRFYAIDPETIGSMQSLETEEFLERTGSNAAAILKLLQETRPEQQERIGRILSYVTEGVRKVYTRVIGQKAAIEFHHDIGHEHPGEFSGWEMSDGTLRMLGLLLAVYQPRQASLIAIEEPEATVHPAAAELLVQILLDAAQDRQVLVTTHSPDILDSKDLRDDQIRVVTIEHGRTKIAPLSDASRRAIREHLYTPGELLRIDELSQDVQAAEDSSGSVDLFGEIQTQSTP